MMTSLITVLLLSLIVSLAIWLWPAFKLGQPKQLPSKKRKPAHLIDRISTDGLKRARMVHDLRPRSATNSAGSESSGRKRATGESNPHEYSVLLRMLLNDIAKAERLIEHELKKGAITRAQAINRVIDSLQYDKAR